MICTLVDIFFWGLTWFCIHYTISLPQRGHNTYGHHCQWQDLSDCPPRSTTHTWDFLQPPIHPYSHPKWLSMVCQSSTTWQVRSTLGQLPAAASITVCKWAYPTPGHCENIMKFVVIFLGCHGNPFSWRNISTNFAMYLPYPGLGYAYLQAVYILQSSVKTAERACLSIVADS
jgi:hypothetical protein